MKETVKVVNGTPIIRTLGTKGRYEVKVGAGKTATFKTQKDAAAFITSGNPTVNIKGISHIGYYKK